MNETTYLIYPTVALFLYDLQEGLDRDTKQIFLNRQRFWRKVDPNLDKQLKELAQFNPQSDKDEFIVTTTIADKVRQYLDELATQENSGVDYVNLYKKALHDELTSPLNNYFSALQLGDSYAIQIVCSGLSGKTDTPQQPIEKLKNIKNLIVSQINHHQNQSEIEPIRQGTLGQTWLVVGKLADGNKTAQQIAEECYYQLTPNPNWKPDFIEHGQLLGASVFEYWHAPSNWAQEWGKFSQNNYHLIICLLPCHVTSTDDLGKKMASVYLDLTKLFCYRHKVLWAYWKSRSLKKELKQQVDEIRELIEQVGKINAQQISLNDIKSTLKKSLPSRSDYAINLNDLDSQYRAIQINLDNYQKRLQKIESNLNTNLAIFREFSTAADERYRQPVERDYASLSVGLTLLEDLSRMIGNVIEVEQAKSDRTLNSTIAATGVGLATSQVAAAVLLVQPPAKNPTEVFFGSLGIGAIASLLAFILLRRLRR